MKKIGLLLQILMNEKFDFLLEAVVDENTWRLKWMKIIGGS